MRNFFSIIVIFAVLAAIGGYVYTQQEAERTRQRIADDLANARRTFAQKARAAAIEAEPDSYLRSMRVALESYKEELSKRVYKGHDDHRKIDAYKKLVDEKFEKKELDEAKRKSMMEGYDIVKEAYDLLMAGNWKPELTAKGSADTRLDIYSMRQISDPDNRPLLEGKFLFWGIEDSTDVRWGNLNLRFWTHEMQQVVERGKKVEKDVEKVLGKSEGEAQPHIIIQTPHKYIDEFPAFVSIGYLWMPLFPREATAVDIEYTYTTRVAGGGEVHSTLKWEKMAIPEAWKLKEGQVWDADVIEATEDEIAGRDPENAEEDEQGKKKEKDEKDE
ncbi:MAG: hypothetical protein IT384_32885 [Deltaproteobacteria bacterium]|nr:hypothetical protein [Deltaproteobacteria bacterium]